MDKLNKAVIIMAKIAEVIHWIGAALMAMVFRNVYLIFKTAEGKTWFSKGATPFQPDIVRMVREIGIFCIAVPVVSFIMSIVLGIVSGNGVHATVELTSVFYGLIVLSLSRFFAYGQQLQEDTEGLV